jgi:hypothetical protein
MDLSFEPGIHAPLGIHPPAAGEGVTAGAIIPLLTSAVQSIRKPGAATPYCKSRSRGADEKTPWCNLGSLGDPMAGCSSLPLIVSVFSALYYRNDGSIYYDTNFVSLLSMKWTNEKDAGWSMAQAHIHITAGDSDSRAAYYLLIDKSLPSLECSRIKVVVILSSMHTEWINGLSRNAAESLRQDKYYYTMLIAIDCNAIGDQ